MQDADRRTSLIVAAGVLLLHLLAVRALIGSAPATWLRPQPSSSEQRSIDVTFISRPRIVPDEDATIHRSPQELIEAQARGAGSGVAAPRRSTAGPDAIETTPALDLRVQEAPMPLPASRDPPFEWRIAIEPRRTRFADTWVPEGDAIAQARFRSKVVGAALGLFGGPSRRCSEVEHRLRQPDCLPPDHDDDEALRDFVNR